MNAVPPSPALPRPEITPINAPYWDALAKGELIFQSCTCGQRWLPPRERCPNCLGTDWRWTRAAGHGVLISWVVYHVAYHECFADRLPYNVAIVELAEGPRLITNVIGCDIASLRAGIRLELAVTEEQGIRRAQFRPLPNPPSPD